MHLFTSDEAEKHPAGQGRNEPDPLEKPKYVGYTKTFCLALYFSFKHKSNTRNNLFTK
jgi:hypothetical protein